MSRFWKTGSQTLAGILLVLAMNASVCFSHTLYMNVVDNEDTTVTVEGMFSTGATAAGLTLYLEDEKEKVLTKMQMDGDGEITFEKPKVPYVIFLDGGPGHTVREPGPR